MRMIWLVAIGIAILAHLFHLLARRPPEDEWLLRVQLRRLLRIHLVLAFVVTLGGGFVLAFAGFFPLAVLPEASRSPWDTLGAAFALTMIAGLILELIRRSDLAATEQGFYMFHIFIPWSAITRLARDGSSLSVRTPKLRRSWNTWTGRALLPLWPWQRSQDTARTIVKLYQECARGRADADSAGAPNSGGN